MSYKSVEIEYTTSPDTFEVQQGGEGLYQIIDELHRMIQHAEDGDKITITIRKPKTESDPESSPDYLSYLNNLSI